MAPPERERVLLVEDNEDDAMLARRALRRLKREITITHVDDGAKAVQYLEAALASGDGMMPRVVLCDLKLPKRTGVEVLQWFRHQPGGEETPFVMLTSSDQPDDIAACREAGADGYIQKPVDYDAYMSVMEEVERFWLEEQVAEEKDAPSPAKPDQRFIRFAKLN
ncbi:response regulator [soil metagenome]